MFLEFLSGTGSVGNVALDMGYDVVSVDRDMIATHRCDIMEWNYRQYAPKYVDVLWVRNLRGAHHHVVRGEQAVHLRARHVRDRHA